MANTPPSILLYGVGSVGAVYLLQLQRAGCTVTAICRSNYTTVLKNGFTITSARLGNTTYHPNHTIRSIEDTPKDTIYDYIIVTTKSFPGSQPSLADQLRPALENRPSTTIVLAQNGIDIENDIAEAYPLNPLLSGVIYLPTTQTSPGVIDNPEMLNLLELGTFPADAPEAHKASARRLAELMVKGGGDASVLEDIQVARWSKLLINASWNPISALSLCTDGAFLRSSEFAYELVWGIMMEVVALARKMGIPGVDEEAAERRFRIAKERAETMSGREPSMLQDVRQGRLFEVEAIVGNTVRVGRKWGVPMPRLETVYALARGRYEAMVEGMS
ncbi:hypothetical protein BBP40_005768 [Aspergillus hancockii]|nr:hypothetical protein BBP40_005768 [Aspergillus hancockii]